MSTAAQTVETLNGDFAQAVALASGANPLVCLQCRKCTSGCPVAARADITAHEVVRLVQLGERAEVLRSRMIWECTSCQTCVTRCPQQVDIPAMMDALRRMARAQGTVTADTTVPVFNDIFLRSVEASGRMYELGLMARFKLRTGDLFSDVGKFPMMLRKGKLALLPKKAGGKAERKRVFQRARERGGKQP
jgi:heterodisulfide reductase subunit C2